MKSRMIYIIVLTGMALPIWLLSTGQAMAQFYDTRSSWFPGSNPSAISPWLEMQRASSSELDSYNQFVRPRLEMERLILAQRREMDRQMDRQKVMQKDIAQVRDFQLQQQRQDNQMQSFATPTGKGAVYDNYLHFYPPPRQRR